MIMLCATCKMYFDDEFRDTGCPHAAFPANDGKNNLTINPNAYLSPCAPLSGPSKSQGTGDKLTGLTRPLFSVLHSSARPDQWRKVYDDWMGKAANPESVEYVLCVDERWGFQSSDGSFAFRSIDYPFDMRAQDKLMWNEGRRCYVDGVNTAARASTGQILIVNADDQFACEGWDESLALLPYRIDGPCRTLLSKSQPARPKNTSGASW